MFEGQIVKVVIPALNEESSLPLVLADVPKWADEVIVVDNGSTDATAGAAARSGARVIREHRRGYGHACLAGIAGLGHCDIVVFMDADFSDHPGEMGLLVGPIARDEADIVIGSRTLGEAQAGALTVPQRLGNALACFLMRLIWRKRFTDLGPFRAVRMSALRAMRMRDQTYGWTVEMQIKAVRQGLRIVEAPVSYRRRVGLSKISGTIRGIVGAGTKILSTIGRSALAPPPAPPAAQRLIVFTRYPRPGQSKTRLIPALGALGAAALQRRMTEHILTALAVRDGPYETEVRYSGGDLRRMRRWLGRFAECRPQGRGDLGDRMRRSLSEAFLEGCSRVVIVGTDCPQVTREHTEAAFDALRMNDVVIGPASDGGYWLIGARLEADIFDSVQWGSDKVFARTRRLVADRGLSLHVLEELSDIDRPADLPALPASLRDERPYLSVIIPALNEAECVAAAIASARADGVEIIVVDGGSVDATVEVARGAAARVVRCPAGRARQMNRGADLARGKVLLFLHADTVLPRNYAAAVFDELAEGDVAGGAFAYATDLRTPPMRIIERIANLRAKYLHLPYGDQCIFVRRAAFDALGGFADICIAEDLDFVRRLRRYGRIAALPRAAITSARRWRSQGIIRTTAINQLILIGSSIGVSHETLAALH